MPLLGNGEYREPVAREAHVARATTKPAGDDSASKSMPPPPQRRQSQHSDIAKSAIMISRRSHPSGGSSPRSEQDDSQMAHASPAPTMGSVPNEVFLGVRRAATMGTDGSGRAPSDTPMITPSHTAPNSPIILPRVQGSGTSTPARPRAATTLDIPGLTKSKASPDGTIAQSDVGSKLVIVMVGLPARGKSYITKKLARYLNWLQHDTKIFNVGEKRRIVALTSPSNGIANGASTNAGRLHTLEDLDIGLTSLDGIVQGPQTATPPTSPSTQLLINDEVPPQTPPFDNLPPAALAGLAHVRPIQSPDPRDATHTREGFERSTSNDHIEQNADFFDPENEQAAELRERVALWTLDELLNFILEKGGSVGILDATNSTIERRQKIIDHIRARAGDDLGILFLESVCIDENLLESNMRLKLSGPDYRDHDPVTALEDFKKRISMYQRKYVPLGDYEEKHGISYVQMVDVGRKIISHRIRGFLSAQTNYYLLNFNLAPRQIWVTRHGESLDNVKGKIGGDSELTENGRAYARALTAFISEQRQLWDIHQQDKAMSTHFPPQKGDSTPPNPTYHVDDDDTHRSTNFCVWTSMLKRSIETAQYFDEEDFDVKQMRMLDELNAGMMEGLTYDEIKSKYGAEYNLRQQNKMRYRYPGPGGEGYLDIINRLRPVIHEVERMTDHVLLVGHRSVARVLLAYFMGLKREDVADLDVPLGLLYMLEPKPYGVDFKAYRYDAATQRFHLDPDYELRRAAAHHNVE